MRWIPALLLLAACSGYDSANIKDFEVDTGIQEAPGTLRVDVIPAADGSALSPQSFKVEEALYVGFPYTLAPTVTVTGTISATTFQLLPTASGQS